MNIYIVIADSDNRIIACFDNAKAAEECKEDMFSWHYRRVVEIELESSWNEGETE